MEEFRNLLYKSSRSLFNPVFVEIRNSNILVSVISFNCVNFSECLSIINLVIFFRN